MVDCVNKEQRKRKKERIKKNKKEKITAMITRQGNDQKDFF